MSPLLLHVFPSFAIGGQQTRFATIANWLGQSFRHRVISIDGLDTAMRLLNPGIDITFLPTPPQTNDPFARFRDIAKTIALAEPDLLITYNWGSIEWAIVNRLRFYRGRPHLHLEDGFGPDEADKQKCRRVLTRRFCLRDSKVVVPSCTLAKIAGTHWKLDPQHVIYIPNGIDTTRFDDIVTDGAPFFRRRSGECIIGCVSPLRSEKNIVRLLRAFSQLRCASVRLVICGDGPERGTLATFAQDLKVSDRVIFTGHVKCPELVMGAFDIFCMTSDTEQMPYAVLEAMSARLPVVATDVGDISKMVADENRSFVVERDDLRRLVFALEQLCRDPTLRLYIGRANRAKVEANYGIEPMVEAFQRVLTDVISGS